MISNRIKTYLFLISILLLGGYTNILLAQPTATIVSPDTAFCTNAGNVDMVIKFSGKNPFGLVYTKYINGVASGTTYRNKAVDQITVDDVDSTFTITLSGTANDTLTMQYRVDEVFDGEMIQKGGEWPKGTGSKLCYGDLDIRVDKMPKPFAGNDLIVCNYSTQLNGTKSLINDSVFWSTTSSGVTFSDIKSEKPNVSLIPQVSSQGAKIFNFKEVNGTCVVTDQVTYTFNGFAEATLSGNTQICGSGDIQTTLVSVANYPIKYTYKDQLTGDISSLITVSSSPFNRTISAIGNQTFKLNTVEDNNGCFTPAINLLSEAKSVDVKPKPIMPSNQVVCSDFATVTVQSDLGSGTWSGLGTFENSTATSTKYTKPSGEWGNDTIFWTEVYGGFCSTKDTAFIEFQKTPISEAGLDSILFLDTELKLQANLPEYGFGTWSSSNESVKFDDASIHDTYVRSLPYEKVRLTWTVVNGICPSTSDYVDILVKGFTYTNGFTPNGDGINDYFEIFGLMQRPILNNELKVFDAVGRVVYSAKDYKNNWDGTDLSGNPLPTGAYYYQFTGDGIEAVQTYLIIKRE